MSNQAVGPIYERIINDVVENSQVDFEESGVPRSTLEELRDIWQKKLSSFNVADFPWDPKPTPAPTTAAASSAGTTTTAPANGHNARSQSQLTLPTPSSSQPAAATTAADGVKIKSEPDTEPRSSLRDSAPSSSKNQPPANRAPSSSNPQAAQRAAALLQNKFGSRANESIGAMQSGMPQTDGANDSDVDVTPRRIKSEAMDHDEDDEDAINSALDDSDDDVENDDDEDDSNPQVMLCLYDKVTRTKNKWKCTLKDGVLTVGGREYVFQKATGEFEW